MTTSDRFAYVMAVLWFIGSGLMIFADLNTPLWDLSLLYMMVLCVLSLVEYAYSAWLREG